MQFVDLFLFLILVEMTWSDIQRGTVRLVSLVFLMGMVGFYQGLEGLAVAGAAWGGLELLHATLAWHRGHTVLGGGDTKTIALLAPFLPYDLWGTWLIVMGLGGLVTHALMRQPRIPFLPAITLSFMACRLGPIVG